MKPLLILIALSILISDCQNRNAGNSEKKSANKYLTVVKDYAHTMMANGRDTYGLEETPLFASALNRTTMSIDSSLRYIKIEGVRSNDRSITGANMIHDIELFHILYDLTKLTGDQIYVDEANKALDYFFNNCQSPVTGLMCWGEHLFRDFYTDDCGFGLNYDYHEATRWPFWEQAYQLAPDACWNFALGEWDHQINDQSTGDFSRHARYTRHETYSGFDFPRYAGQMIERWAYAYQRPENAARPRKEDLKTAINVLFNRMVENSKISKSGLLIAGRASKGDHNMVVWLTSNLELARCLEAAAPSMDANLAEEMQRFALKQDEDFLKAPHRLDSAEGGFAVTLHAQTGLPRTRSMNRPYTSTWSSGYGYGTHANVASLCYGRFKVHQALRPEMAEKYKNFMLLASDRYLDSSPDTTALLKPKELSDAIELMLNCHELTGNTKYLERAEYFAGLGVELFLNDGSPLPKASNRHGHYESITGGPTFMSSLLRLSQNM